MLCPNNHKNCIASKMIQMYNLVVAQPDEKKVIELLDSHIEALLYNIASIASVTALLDEKTKIELKHISFIKDYIIKQCKKKTSGQQGGSLPSEYFGYNSGAYSEANYGGVNYTNVVWDGADAAIRQAIPITGGSMNKMKNLIENNKEVSKYIKKVMSFNDVKISTSAMNELLKVVNIHLNCVGDDMMKYNKIKPSLLEKIFKTRKHAVFK